MRGRARTVPSGRSAPQLQVPAVARPRNQNLCRERSSDSADLLVHTVATSPPPVAPLLLAYSVTDILWLRLLAVASSLAAILYFLLQPTPLWAAFGWSVLFTGINLFQAWRLVVERRLVKLIRVLL